jgi:RNA polymerase sigma-70 factor (ECF subfamily)
MIEASAPVNDLAKACAHSADAAEWGELVRRCAPLVSMMAVRVSRMWSNTRSAAAIDDIVQEVFLKLCEQERRILREFEPRGEDSFLALLRTIAASVANDYFRRTHSQKRGGHAITLSIQGEETELPLDGARPAARMVHATLLAQLDGKLRADPEKIGERDRALFWLYYLQGYTAEEIAHITAAGLTAKGVESALRRVTVWLRAEVGGAKSQAEFG